MLSVFLIVAAGISISVYRQPLRYEVVGKLLVQRARGDLLLTPTTSAGFGVILPQQQDLTAEAELIKSPSLSKAVVKKLGLYQAPQTIKAQAPVTLAALLPVPESLAAWLPTWLNGGTPDATEPRERDPNTASPLDRVASGIRSGLTVQALPNSSIIEVRYRTSNPSKAVDVVNTLMTLYLDRYLEVRRTPGVTDFFTAQRDLYGTKLQEAEEALRQFEERTALINTAVQMEAYSRQLADAEMKLLKTGFDMEDKRKKLATNRLQVERLPERIINSQSFRVNPMVDTLQLRLMDLETERQRLLQSYTEQDRRVHDIEAQIAMVQQRLAEQPTWVAASESSQLNPIRTSLQESILGTEASLSRLHIDQEEAAAQVTMIRRRIGEIARQAVDRAQLTREIRTYEEAYLLYQKKVEEARISDAMDQQKMVNVSIAEEASPPTSSLTQKRLSYIFALMVGVVAGVGAGFMREFFDDSVQGRGDVQASTTLPVLASIPEESPPGKKNGKHGA